MVPIPKVTKDTPMVDLFHDKSEVSFETRMETTYDVTREDEYRLKGN